MTHNSIRRGVRRARIIVVTLLILTGVLMPAMASAAPPASAAAAPSSQASQGFWYTVRPGDTLSGIARQFGTSVNAIMAANNLHSSRIFVGQVLWIPVGGGGGGGWCSQYYVVRPGDTLSGIARWFGVSTQSLAQANNISDPSRIYVGQRLCIPAGYHPQPIPPQPWPPQPVPPQPWPPQPMPPGPACGQFYTVRPGDTLTRIAAMCGTTVQSLVWLNNIQNPSIIVPGQVLRIF